MDTRHDMLCPYPNVVFGDCHTKCLRSYCTPHAVDYELELPELEARQGDKFTFQKSGTIFFLQIKS
jgi:hypothetical protein